MKKKGKNAQNNSFRNSGNWKFCLVKEKEKKNWIWMNDVWMKNQRNREK